jgi:hypothetical protein
MKDRIGPEFRPVPNIVIPNIVILNISPDTALSKW